MSTKKMLREFVRAVRDEFNAQVLIKRDRSSHHKLTIIFPSGAVKKLSAPSSPHDPDQAIKYMLKQVRDDR